MSSLEDRVATIEAAARRWRAVAVAALGVAIVALVFAARTLRTPSELRIVNGDGAELDLRADHVTMTDRAGRHIVELDGAGEGTIDLVGTQDKRVNLTSRGVVGLSLFGENHVTTMLTAGDAFAELTLSNRGDHVFLYAANGLGTNLSMSSPGESMIMLANSEQLYPRMQMSTKDTRQNVVLEANPNGANVQLDDQTGRRELTTKP
jgi:hypothetical protein